ncbi:hypothetical protein PanWU01x14_284530 [Parasponia andersonii]|uniref:Transmembrane protein n=1 Tax=Parasponia andersonii TaxID=3476 RepID=A0A2P5AZU3_PARAD|nr:hypothetical protein PanWU01x14_284530 [Parasponia andersonii]
MESSIGVGFMAVFAVTGSVVLLVHQVHKRVLADFMKDIEFEFGNGKRSFGIGTVKRTCNNKTVRFADDVVEPSSNNKEYRKRQMEKQATAVPNKGHSHEVKNTMPANRQVLYRGIIKHKLAHHHIY